MKQKKIVFLGTHGQFNIGDELLLETFLTELGEENFYSVNSYDPAFTKAQLAPRFQVDVFHTTNQRGRFLQALWNCDLLFFGGGSIIKELYASVGRSRYSTLLMVLLTVTFTRWVGRKPIVMSNIGVGPLQTPWGERLASWILRQVTILSVRDMKSYKTCLRLGLSPERVQLVPDAVFVTDPKIITNYKHLLPSRKLRIALNLNYNIENPANWENFMQNLETGLRILHATHRLEIHTLPMQSQFNPENDWKTLAAFRQRIPEIEVREHRPETFREAALIISECDILMAERLHSLVMAAILGKPFLALIYDVKVRELVSSLEMIDYAFDINQPFDPLELKCRTEKLQQNAPLIGEHLLCRSANLRQELGGYFRVLKKRLVLPGD